MILPILAAALAGIAGAPSTAPAASVGVSARVEEACVLQGRDGVDLASCASDRPAEVRPAAFRAGAMVPTQRASDNAPFSVTGPGGGAGLTITF